jgi:hypothetical protein
MSSSIKKAKKKPKHCSRSRQSDDSESDRQDDTRRCEDARRSQPNRRGRGKANEIDSRKKFGPVALRLRKQAYPFDSVVKGRSSTAANSRTAMERLQNDSSLDMSSPSPMRKRRRQQDVDRDALEISGCETNPEKVVTVSDNRAEELSAGGMKESSLLLTYQSRELQLGASATASVTDQVSCLVNS